MTKVITAAAAAVMATTLVKAQLEDELYLIKAPDLIPVTCLKKLPIVGKASDGAEAFDDFWLVSNRITQQSYLSEYSSCVAEDGSLLSIQLAYHDAQKGETRRSKRAGPYLGTCENFKLERKEERLDTLRVFEADDKISGIGLAYSADQTIVKIGKSSQTYTDFNLPEPEALIGFFGWATDWGVI